MLMAAFVSHLLVKNAGRLGSVGNPSVLFLLSPPASLPSLLNLRRVLWREVYEDNPFASVCALVSFIAPPPLSTSVGTTKAVFCHKETAAVSECQNLGFFTLHYGWERRALVQTNK